VIKPEVVKKTSISVVSHAGIHTSRVCGTLARDDTNLHRMVHQKLMDREIVIIPDATRWDEGI
jgi:hypothetical protein